MIATLLHFVAGTLGALAVFMVLTRLSGATSFSAPFGVIFIGIACAVLAHFLSQWATPVVIAIYASASVGEFLQERKAREAANKSGSPSG
jgi:hypothetical protein